MNIDIKKLFFIVDENVNSQYKFSNLKLFLPKKFKENEINDLQKNLRKEINSISNIFIYKKTSNYYECIYYPTFIRNLIPEELSSVINYNYCSELSKYIMLVNKSITKQNTETTDIENTEYRRLLEEQIQQIIRQRRLTSQTSSNSQSTSSTLSQISDSVREYIKEHINNIEIIEHSSTNNSTLEGIPIIWKDNSCYFDSVLTLLLYTNNNLSTKDYLLWDDILKGNSYKLNYLESNNTLDVINNNNFKSKLSKYFRFFLTKIYNLSYAQQSDRTKMDEISQVRDYLRYFFKIYEKKETKSEYHFFTKNSQSSTQFLEKLLEYTFVDKKYNEVFITLIENIETCDCKDINLLQFIPTNATLNNASTKNNWKSYTKKTNLDYSPFLITLTSETNSDIDINELFENYLIENTLFNNDSSIKPFNSDFIKKYESLENISKVKNIKYQKKIIHFQFNLENGENIDKLFLINIQRIHSMTGEKNFRSITFNKNIKIINNISNELIEFELLGITTSDDGHNIACFKNRYDNEYYYYDDKKFSNNSTKVSFERLDFNRIQESLLKYSELYLYKIIDVKNYINTDITCKKELELNTKIFSNSEIEWFLNKNQALLTITKDNVKCLVKTDEDLLKFTNSSCIIFKKTKIDELFEFIDHHIKDAEIYKEFLDNKTDVGEIIKRLIYNRPLIFTKGYENNTEFKGIKPGNPTILDEIAGKYNPNFLDDTQKPLIPIAQFLGFWTLTPIINSGNRKTNACKNREREDKFFDGNINDGNYNTEAYVCAMPSCNLGIGNLKSKYFNNHSDFNAIDIEIQSLINLDYAEEPIYFKHIHFYIESFLEKCKEVSIDKNIKICPVFTNLDEYLNYNILKDLFIEREIIQDTNNQNEFKKNINLFIIYIILSILNNNEEYLKTFPAIRLSNLLDYDDITNYESVKFKNDFEEDFQKIFNSSTSFKIFHTHENRGNPEIFLTNTELTKLMTDFNIHIEGREIREAVLFNCNSNAFVGNEYWKGVINDSSQTIIAHSTSIGELLNPFINTGILNRIPNNDIFLKLKEQLKKYCRELRKHKQELAIAQGEQVKIKNFHNQNADIKYTFKLTRTEDNIPSASYSGYPDTKLLIGNELCYPGHTIKKDSNINIKHEYAMVREPLGELTIKDYLTMINYYDADYLISVNSSSKFDIDYEDDFISLFDFVEKENSDLNIIKKIFKRKDNNKQIIHYINSDSDENINYKKINIIIDDLIDNHGYDEDSKKFVINCHQGSDRSGAVSLYLILKDYLKFNTENKTFYFILIPYILQLIRINTHIGAAYKAVFTMESTYNIQDLLYNILNIEQNNEQINTFIQKFYEKINEIETNKVDKDEYLYLDNLPDEILNSKII